MNRNFLLGLLFVWLLCCNVPDLSLAEQTGPIPRSTNFIILIDPSPSMFEQRDASEASKAVEAKLILRQMSDFIPEIGYSVSLTLPATRRVIGPTPYKREAFRKIIAGLPEKLSDTQKKRPHSLDSALLQAQSILSKLNDKTSLIILSDGRTDRGIDPIGTARRLIGQTPGICFDIISLADNTDSQVMLRKLAGINDCVYTQGRGLLASRTSMQQFVQNVFFLQLPQKPSRRDLANLNLKPGSELTAGGSGSPPFEFILFDSRDHTIKQAEMPYLVINAVILKSIPELHVQIEGHTDNTGKQSDNRLLSTKRAKAVSDELVRRGIGTDRISIIGKGESKPALSNLTPAGRTLNRRVNIVVKEK